MATCYGGYPCITDSLAQRRNFRCGDAALEFQEILKVESVVKKFGDFVALNGISISVKGDGITSIIGPNGAGKTTLINVITGRLKADSGRIIFMGSDITRKPPHEIVKMGIARTYQVINLFGTLSVFENVNIPLLARGKSIEEAEEILRRFHLEEYKDIRVSKLPHGIQRLVEIAVALATGPRLMILDEPTAGLNLDEREHVTKVILQLSRSTSVILVEHDMDVVFSLSKRIIVMNKGEVVAEGSPEEITENKFVREIYLGI